MSKIIPAVLELTRTAYNELRVEQSTPITQISSRYDLLTNVLTVIDSAGLGKNSIVDNKFTCQTGASANGLASILTLRQIGSRPGQGLISRFDAIFTVGILGSQQAAGLITSENSYVFAYLGENFGIVHAHGGTSEEQELTITVAASGVETATININGISFSVPLTAGTTQHNALEISDSLNSQVANYNFTSNDNQVVAQALLSGPQDPFSFSSTGTAIATWFEDHAGVSATIDFIPQADWNVDTRLTEDPDDPFRVLDPTKGNFYQIQICSNFGAVRFSLEDEKTGKLDLVHILKSANKSTETNVTNPTFRLGWLVQNFSNTTNLTCSGSEASAFIEGVPRRNNAPRSARNNQLSVGTSLTNIMTFRNRIHFAGKVNRVEIYPQILSVSSQANKSTFFVFLLGAVFAGDVDFFYIDKDNSVMEAATDSVGVSGGVGIGSLTINPDGSETLRFNQTPDQDTIILPGQTLTIAAFAASGAGGDMQQTFTWQEDTL